MCSPLKGFLLIVPLKATRDSQRFRFWLRGVQFDSEVWCTPWSLTPQCNAHCGDFFKWIARPNRNQIRKYFSLFIRGLRWVWIKKNGGRKYRDTLLSKVAKPSGNQIKNCKKKFILAYSHHLPVFLYFSFKHRKGCRILWNFFKYVPTKPHSFQCWEVPTT